MFQKAKPVHNGERRRRWVYEHLYCFACGRGLPPKFGFWLECHHIAKQGRSDEECNLLMLCKRDHDLAEGLLIRENGKLLPKLTLAHCLWLKKERDPDNWLPERLTELRQQALPELEVPPAYFLEEFNKRRGKR